MNTIDNGHEWIKSGAIVWATTCRYTSDSKLVAHGPIRGVAALYPDDPSNHKGGPATFFVPFRKGTLKPLPKRAVELRFCDVSSTEEEALACYNRALDSSIGRHESLIAQLTSTLEELKAHRWPASDKGPKPDIVRIAVIKSDAVRDVQCSCKVDADPLDDDAWMDMHDAQIFLGVFKGPNEISILKEAAQYAGIPIENVLIGKMPDTCLDELGELLVEKGACIRAIPKRVTHVFEKEHAREYPEGKIEWIPEYNREMLVVTETPDIGGKFLVASGHDTDKNVRFQKPCYDSLADAVNALRTTGK